MAGAATPLISARLPIGRVHFLADLLFAVYNGDSFRGRRSVSYG
jgi:hypothetical protein